MSIELEIDLEGAERALKGPAQRISRWLWLRLVGKLVLYMVLILGAWGTWIWASFLLAFPLGLVTVGLSLFFLAWALNRQVEDKFLQAGEMYADAVTPRAVGTRQAVAARDIQADELLDDRAISEWVPESSLDVITHETTRNGDGDSEESEIEVAPTFEIVRDEPELDPVDEEIDDILRGGMERA